MESFHRFHLQSSLLPPGTGSEQGDSGDRSPRYFMQSLSAAVGPVLNGSMLSCPPSHIDSEEKAEDISRCLAGDSPVPKMYSRLGQSHLSLTSTLTTQLTNGLQVASAGPAARQSAGARIGNAALRKYRSLPGHRSRATDPLCCVDYFAANCWTTEARARVPSTWRHRGGDSPSASAPATPPRGGGGGDAAALPPRATTAPPGRALARVDRLRRLRRRRLLRTEPLPAVRRPRQQDAGAGRSADKADLTAALEREIRPLTAPLRQRRSPADVRQAASLLEALLLGPAPAPDAAAAAAPDEARSRGSSARARGHASSQLRRMMEREWFRKAASKGLKRIPETDPRVASRAILW